ncbi:UNKNOWN [Stylonychia lemnae]|uniref:Uncharacterized protein n=1 Tax=Stylonychia lemnae TaxID=5949 RepID=A0A078A6N3_STYLE|nr:UNKNOWN [Stylonychia lemnae]|eukprot:CDW77900.1 UNKNOWN [Stylonychia lemnae]
MKKNQDFDSIQMPDFDELPIISGESSYDLQISKSDHNQANVKTESVKQAKIKEFKIKKISRTNSQKQLSQHLQMSNEQNKIDNCEFRSINKQEDSLKNSSRQYENQLTQPSSLSSSKKAFETNQNKIVNNPGSIILGQETAAPLLLDNDVSPNKLSKINARNTVYGVSFNDQQKSQGKKQVERNLKDKYQFVNQLMEPNHNAKLSQRKQSVNLNDLKIQVIQENLLEDQSNFESPYPQIQETSSQKRQYQKKVFHFPHRSDLECRHIGLAEQQNNNIQLQNLSRQQSRSNKGHQALIKAQYFSPQNSCLSSNQQMTGRQSIQFSVNKNDQFPVEDYQQEINLNMNLLFYDFNNFCAPKLTTTHRDMSNRPVSKKESDKKVMNQNFVQDRLPSRQNQTRGSLSRGQRNSQPHANLHYNQSIITGDFDKVLGSPVLPSIIKVQNKFNFPKLQTQVPTTPNRQIDPKLKLTFNYKDLVNEISSTEKTYQRKKIQSKSDNTSPYRQSNGQNYNPVPVKTVMEMINEEDF